jgi:hypothetical protein
MRSLTAPPLPLTIGMSAAGGILGGSVAALLVVLFTELLKAMLAICATVGFGGAMGTQAPAAYLGVGTRLTR